MSSKKILAASLAAVLATGSIAAVATADAPATGMLDDAIVIGAKPAAAKNVYVAHVEGKTSDLASLIEMTSGNITNGVYFDDGVDPVKNGHTDNAVNPYNRLALGFWFNASLQELSSFKVSNATMSVTVAGQTQKWKINTASGVVSTDGGLKDAKSKTATVKFGDVAAKDLPSMTTHNLTDSEGTGITAKVLGPKAFRPEFSGLGDTNTLEAIVAADSQITYSFDVEMSEDDWKAFAEESGITWDDANGGSGANWSGGSFDALIAKEGTKLLSSLAGIEGTSYAPDGNTKVGYLNATTNAVTATKFEKKNANEGVYDEYDLSGFVAVNVGTNANLKQLKAINAGGTLTITLNQAIDPSKVVGIGTATFYGASGYIPLPLTGNYTISEDNKSFVFELPAGLTWSEQLNQPNAFRVSYNIALAELAGTDTNNPTTTGSAINGPDGKPYKVVSFVFQANGGASVDPGNSGNSGSQGGNTTNPGSTSGNPNTGIALAVAPIVLAAGAVVTIASKKRK